MSETKFTPGPWHWDDGCLVSESMPSEQILWPDNVPGGDGLTWQQMLGACGHHSETNAEANAHLIASAPDLYKALEAVIAISDRKHKAWDRAKAALAKARGAHRRGAP